MTSFRLRKRREKIAQQVADRAIVAAGILTQTGEGRVTAGRIPISVHPGRVHRVPVNEGGIGLPLGRGCIGDRGK